MSGRRRWGWWILAIALVVIAAAAWLAYRADEIYRNLQQARTSLSAVVNSVENGSPAPASEVRSAASHAATADAAARDPLWSLVARIPGIGDPMRTATGIAEIGQQITHQSLPLLVSVDAQVQRVKQADALHSLPLSTMKSAAGQLDSADSQLQSDLYAVRHLPSAGWISQVQHARNELEAELTTVSAQVHTDAVATTYGLPMLGADGPRRYLVLFENPSEARPDMGLISGYAEIVANNGRVQVVKFGSNSDLPTARPASAAEAATLTSGYRSLGAGTNWLSSNLSPDFPENAALLAGMYYSSTGETIDGVIALDPQSLGTILSLTGQSVNVSGVGKVTASNLTAFLESKEYSLPLTEDQRKELVADAGQQTVQDLLKSHVSTIDVARALASLAGQGHLRLYSTHSNEQAALASFPLAGSLPKTSRPFVGVYVTNSSARKLDYYLNEHVSYQGLSCSTSTTKAWIAVTLDNAAPANLPPFTAEGNVPLSAPLPSGENRELVSVVLPAGSQLGAAAIDGHSVPWLLKSTETGSRPVALVEVDLPRGQPQYLTFDVTEAHTHGPALIGTQPLPRLPQVTASGASC